MKRYLIIWIAAGLAALAAPAVASAATTITIQDDNTYSPESATLDLGAGSFDWEWGPGGAGTFEDHNVVQGETFSPGKPLFDSGEPVKARPEPFSVTASAGSFSYFCQIHVGMVGDVNVRPVLGPSDTGAGPIAVAWADATTTTGSKYDVRYKAGRKWKTWKKKTGKLSGSFGRNKKPAKVKAGRRYQFQARSRAGKDRSDWSPKLIVQR
jgi:plastocyanin